MGDIKDKSTNVSNGTIVKTAKTTRMKIRNIIDGAKEQAGKSAFIGFLGAFYVLSTTGTVNERDILTIAISISVFIAGTVVILIIWIDRRRNEKELQDFKTEMSILKSDFFILNSKHCQIVDSLSTDHHIQSNHLYELLRNVEDTGHFAVLIYSYESGDILSINHQFRMIFNMDEKYLESITNPENTQINNLISIFRTLIHQDHHNELIQTVGRLIKGDIKRFSMNVYARINITKPLKYVPFKIIFTKLEYAIDGSLHIVFIDETKERSRDEIMRMSFDTIISYTKELLSHKIDNQLSETLIKGLIEYQKSNKRILISDISDMRNISDIDEQ